LLLFAFVLGVGVSVHPLHALMIPGYLLLVVTAAPRREVPRLILPAALLALLGLSLHLYTPLRSGLNPRLDWGNPQSPAALWDYLTASQYRERMFSLSAGEVLENVVYLGRLLRSQWLWPALLLPVAGMVLIARRHPQVALALAVMALLDVLYAVNYDIPWEIEVYYIPLVVVLALAGGRLAATRGRWTVPVTVVVLILAGWNNLGVAGRRGVDTIDRYGRDVLDALPADAILITPPTNPTFILLYLTTVEQARPDVEVYVHGKQSLARLGEALDSEVRAAVTAAQLVGDRSRPVFYAVRDPLDDLPGYELAPSGVLYQVRPRAPAASAAGAAAPWTSPRLDPATIGPNDDFRLRLVAARYLLVRSDHAMARGDTTAARNDRAAAERVAGDRAELHGGLAARAAAEGRRQAAIAHYRDALAIREDAVHMNRLGRLLHETGNSQGAEAAFRRAIELNPELAVAYSNLGALLGSIDDLDGAIAALRQAIALDPLSIKAYNNLGMALLKTGDRAGAAQAWRRSLALNPEQVRIARNLAAIEQ
jgi:tetratricopeptide (TPR) repeat protein